MSNGKITSTVIKEPKDWADISYLIPHEPLRMDMIEVDRILQEKNFDGTVDWKVEAFYKWYEIFYEIVHHHHDTEEKIFFPVLAARCKVPERMSKDHVGLLKMMDDIKKSKATFASAKSTEDKKRAAASVRNLWAEFSREMKEHLAEEERVLAGLIRTNMTEKEHDALIDKILQSLGLSGNALMLPWIERSMRIWRGDAETEKFYTLVPAPIRFLNNWFWKPAYLKNNWGLLHSIETNEKPQSSSSLVSATVVVAAAVSVAAFLYTRS